MRCPCPPAHMEFLCSFCEQSHPYQQLPVPGTCVSLPEDSLWPQGHSQPMCRAAGGAAGNLPWSGPHLMRGRNGWISSRLLAALRDSLTPSPRGPQWELSPRCSQQSSAPLHTKHWPPSLFPTLLASFPGISSQMNYSHPNFASGSAPR